MPKLRVSALAGQRWRGRLLAGTWVVPCVLGPAGITHQKREGDRATPAGRFRPEYLMFRGDRGPRPRSRLLGLVIQEDMGWCDDPSSACYNQPVTIPYRPSHERLLRVDRLYDVLVVLNYNRAPIRKMRGSAIFLHMHGAPGAPTAGCVAVDPLALRKLIIRVGRSTRVIIT